MFDGFETTCDDVSYVHFTCFSLEEEEDVVSFVCNAKCHPVINRGAEYPMWNQMNPEQIPKDT